MLKAKLVSDLPLYLNLKKYLLWSSLPFAFTYMIFTICHKDSLYLGWLMIPVFLIPVAASILFQKKLKRITEDQKIEIYPEKIELIKGVRKIKEIRIGTADKIELKINGVFEDNLRELFDEGRGKSHTCYIIVKNSGSDEKFDFLIDSHYMMRQLDKLVNIWKTNHSVLLLK